MSEPVAPPVAPPGSAGSWLREHALAVAGSLLFAGGFAWLLEAGALPIVPPAHAWDAVRPWVIPIYALSFMTVHVLRCGRWLLLVAPAQRPRLGLTIGIGLVAYAAVVLLPFRLGEAARPALMRSRARIPLGTSAGVVGAERIVDGLVLSVMLLVALLRAEVISPLPDHIGELPIPASIISTVAWAAVVLFASLSLCMLGFYLWQAPLRRLIEEHLGKVLPGVARRLAVAVGSVAEGLRFLKDLSSLPAFAALTCLYWALNVAGILILLWGAGIPSPTLGQATVVLGVLGLGLVVPNAPGFFGTFQISAYSAMVLFYSLPVVTSAGAVFVFLLYVIQMSLTLGAGAVALGSGLRSGPEPAYQIVAVARTRQERREITRK